jgi:hypothetical protein
MSRKGEGKGYAFLVAHVPYEGDDCLKWPFSTLHGYGQLGHNGWRGYAHRLMCELAHGEPPSPEHQAAHSCGNGHLRCVNPRHLSWKTRSENQLDCRQHGTQAKSTAGIYGRLSHKKAAEIRALQGVKLQREVAEQYGVSESAISDVWLGRTWTREHKRKPWPAEDTAALKKALESGSSFPEAARLLGRPLHVIQSYAYRIGLKSGRPIQKITDRPGFFDAPTDI